ncbi:MAG: GerMN domain-containing protein [Bacilli bacterium]
MLKRMSIKKIMVSTTAVLILLIIYLIPDNRKEIELKNDDIEYTYNNITSAIYLVDRDDYVARTNIASCNCSDVDKAKDLLEGLIIGGKKSGIIPNGFRSIIPPDTSILDINLENKILTINFSKELLEVSEPEEEKMIESIIYTLTSIKGIDKVIIKVEGNILTNLPHSRKTLPSVLDKSYGINKNYELVTINNIDSYTVYYVNKYNDNKYYVPVTKYVNKEENDPIKVIIKELSSSPIYETNLMSYLNASTTLNDYELIGDNLKLNFNELLLSDPDSNKILEEVIYTIGLSINDAYDNLETVSFYVNDNEIYTLTLSELK